MAGRNTKNGKKPEGESAEALNELHQVLEISTEEARSELPAEPKSGRKAKAAAQDDETEAEVGPAPKAFMVPYVLLMLRSSLLHGYAIWERLMLMGIPGLDESDRAYIYRTLRQLEREGKVKSEWDTSADGPARRVYSLTDAGENFLQIWAVGLDQYRQSLDFFFKMYTNPFGINPMGGTNFSSFFDKDKKGKQ